MKAPGAKPGRVGKCPKCGALIKVQAGPPLRPDATPPSSKPEPVRDRRRAPVITTSEGGYGVASGAMEESTFEKSREPSRPVGLDARAVRPPDLGPIKAPLKNETTLSGSFDYPLRSWSSVGLLVFIPPILVVTTSPLDFLVQALLSDSPFTVPAYISMIPAAMFMSVVAMYVLIYLGNILIESATGDPIPPRPPGIDEDLPRAFGRWSWALCSGVVLGGLPALFYWINCGEVDWIDRLVFFNLSMIGIAYAQLALLSTLLHDDPLAANPFTVIKAMYRLGWNYVGICFFSITACGLMVGGLALTSMVNHSFAHLLVSWIYWIFAFYLGMVTFRRLGLYCMRQKLIQAWFADRPRWGVGKETF